MLTVEVLSLPQVEGADVFVLTNNECGFISSYKNTMFNRNLEIYIKKEIWDRLSNIQYTWITDTDVK